MKAKDKVQKLSENTEDFDRVAKLDAMAYILYSIGKSYLEEAEDILKKYGLYQYSIKYFSGMLDKTFDRYNRTMIEVIKNQDAFLEFTERFQNLKEELDKLID